MKRIMEKSPVVGYQLFHWEKRKVDGMTGTLAKYYVRHLGKDVCTKTDRLTAAKNFVKKMAGEPPAARMEECSNTGPARPRFSISSATS